MTDTPESQDDRLLLILSPERSGSTLLSVMLGGHPHIIAPPEMHLLAYSHYDSWFHSYPLAINSLNNLCHELGFTFTPTTIQQTFSGWPTENIYRWLMANASRQSAVIVDKTPRYSRELSTLQRAERLNPFFIWLIRHPLGVAASQLSLQIEDRRSLNHRLLPRWKFPLFLIKNKLLQKRDVQRQAAYWADVNTRIAAFLDSIPSHRYLKVYFEELVQSPEVVIQQICQALNVQFDPCMLQPQRNIPSALQWGLGDQKIRDHKTIEASVAFRWRTQYSKDILDADTKVLMKQIGVVTC